MRLITKYLFREMSYPFLISLLMITFILFVNFLLRAIDRFLGKGLEILVILEYLFLNLAWIIALSIPMAMLLATLATFGRLSEDNEINADLIAVSRKLQNNLTSKNKQIIKESGLNEYLTLKNDQN